MLSLKKRIGIGLVLAGCVLLVFALLAGPLWQSPSAGRIAGISGIVCILASLPLMWLDGIRNLRARGKKGGHFHEMRQSGFFDVLTLLFIIAVILGILCGIGYFSYQSTLARHQTMPEFVDYTFRQDLGLLAESYSSFGSIALILLAFVAIGLLYMRFVSPLVRADESLRLAHGVYRRVAQYTAAIFITLVMLFPIYWMIISSFKTSTELLAPVPTLWPSNFIWENYPNVLNRAPFVRYLINTLITTIAIMCGELTIGVLAAYGFSKGNFRGKEVMFVLVLGALMVPIQVTFVPIYVMLARLNSIDTYLGVILPNLVSAYFIFMLRQNFMAVDNSYIEAGKVDGMGRFGTIIHVLCPMCKPTLITVSIISFINGWNSYFWPKMVTKTEASRTIAVGVQQLKNTFAGQEVSNYNEIMAGAVMAIVPIIFLFLVLQKYIMTGMSKAAMK